MVADNALGIVAATPGAEDADAKAEGGEGEETEEDLPGDACKLTGTPLEQRLKSAALDRERGMKAFRAGNWEKAVDAWSMSRGSLKYIIDQEYLKDDPDALAVVKLDQYKMHLNLAQAFLNKGEFRQALEYAGRALTYDVNSVKALYRTSAAWKGISHYEEARNALAKLLAVDPQHAAAKQMLNEITREEKAALKTAKKSAKHILGGMEKDHDYRVEGERSESWFQLLKSCCRRKKTD
eukprot:TRINITY_DN45394_c0_g1_i1.p1 TRINITY_DN45394_c0_g1~~TRINITY_DN45394_c0_g1_i1.p1  ORF type:complete len:238 (-),score=48.94 TRINITY_DN45394_c0_g1_i1:57-770(-)